MRDWLSFWNSPNRIYVNDRHRDVHYRDVALQIRALVPSATATVVDYGCGEATAADLVAQAAGRLILSDGAPAVRDKLSARFSGNAKVSVLAPQEVAMLAPGSIDCIVMNSVAQYLQPTELDGLLATFRRLLTADGRFVIGDVIPPHTSAATEVGALISLAWRNGFLAPALAGLVRTLFSDYRALRTRLGLTHYTESEMLTKLADAGFTARRRHPNIEHNQQRMTFVARPA
jgi:SAM-dependent methyltransferase